MSDPVTACIAIIQDYNETVATKRRLLRAAKNGRPLRFATRDEIALSDSLASTAGIIRTKVRGRWIDAYAAVAIYLGGINPVEVYAAMTTQRIPVSKGTPSRNSRHDPRARKARQVAKASALAARIEAVQ
jgi:hypothetical protein